MANPPPKNIQKKNLFDDQDDNGFVPKKSAPVKEVVAISQPSPKVVEPVKQTPKIEAKKKGIFDEEDDAPTLAPKQVAPTKNESPKKKNLFDDEDDAPMIPKKQPAKV
jgi:hypothetical protein